MIGYLKFYTNYSISEGIVEINNIVNRIVSDRYLSILVSDYFNLSGLVSMFERCREFNVKPLMGCEVNVLFNYDRELYCRIIIIVKEFKQLKVINKVINKAWYRYRDGKQLFINVTELIYLKEFIMIVSNIDCDFSKVISNNINYCIKLIRFLKNYIKYIYIGYDVRDSKDINLINSRLITIAAILNLKMVAINNTNCLNVKDIKALMINYSIVNRLRLTKLLYNNNTYLSRRILSKIIIINKVNLTNTVVITKLCNLTISKGRVTLPKVIKQINDDRLLINLVIRVFYRRYGYKVNRLLMVNRLKYELKIIIALGFSRYFLIVYDFIKWANINNIIVGPGRGSGAGSITSYILNITKVNPLNHNLLFERFLNVRKRTIPDFDVDICKEKRFKVMNYLRRKYGKYRVANITTFGKLAIKNTIRDCSRAAGINYNIVNKIIKEIGFVKLNEQLNIVIRDNYFIRVNVNRSKVLRKLIKLSLLTEGLIKNLGIHAGGLIIICTNFYNLLPIYIIDNNRESISTQLDKYNLEKMGLVKFDILGLNTLSILNRLIIACDSGCSFNILNFKDVKTYELICHGNTIGVFQLESYRLRKYLMTIKPKTFNDIINIISLYRPGPMKLLKRYNVNKLNVFNNKYIDTLLKGVFKKTKGIIIFQEQVMVIINKLFNIDLNEADEIRRRLNKVDINIAGNNNLFNEIYINDNNVIGYKVEALNRIIKKLIKFSGYSFNKAHAVSYALITFFMAFLKANYKLIFYITYLNNSIDNKIKTLNIFKDIKVNNIKLVIPNINNCYYKFKILNGKSILFGLIGIKNISLEIWCIIKYERNKGCFRSFKDFIERLKLKISDDVIRSIAYSNLFNNYYGLKIKLIKIMELYLTRREEINYDYCNRYHMFNDHRFMLMKEREFIGFNYFNPFRLNKINFLGYQLIFKIFIIVIRKRVSNRFILFMAEVNRFMVRMFIVYNNVLKGSRLRVNSFYLIRVNNSGLIKSRLITVRYIKRI